MKDFIEKLNSRLEESETRYDDVSFAQLNEFGRTLDYEYAKGKREGVAEAIEIVNELAEEYKTCYKSCTECEAYDKEKHHCPKFCYIIAETVKEIGENHKGGWIPCSKRLPENNKVVLCWVVSTTIASGETYIIGSCDRGFWFLQTYEIGHHHFPVKDYEVIAWQPLPESYKEEQ